MVDRWGIEPHLRSVQGWRIPILLTAHLFLTLSLGADRENRTLNTYLEGRSFTIKLYPRGRETENRTPYQSRKRDSNSHDVLFPKQAAYPVSPLLVS